MNVSPVRVTQGQFDLAVKQLGEYVAIPSVSNTASPYYSMDTLKKAADYAGSKLNSLGFKVSYPTVKGSPPFVLAERITDAAKPTILLYAHYDVQPVEESKWLSPPFVMTERVGRLYGRGASDDKAGIIGIITALSVALEAKMDLPNVKILFEGEEEFDSSYMTALLQQEAHRLQADALVVLDGMNRDAKAGTLTSSTRGLVNLELEVSALEKPVHSGIGCLVPDPAQVLTGLLHSLKNPRDIPGFMVGAEKVSEGERQILRESSISPETYKKDMGMNPELKLRGSAEYSVYERILSEPSISVVNMTCGKQGGGNSIQDKARCTIGIRVLPGQDPEKVAEAVMNHIRSQQVNAKVDIKQPEAGAWAWKADLTSKFSRMYFEALQENFPQSCAMPCGGALPLMHEFKQFFPKMDMMIPAVEDPNTDAHSHNESQEIQSFRWAIDSMISFLGKAAKVQAS